MPLSCERFRDHLLNFGYVNEAKMVYDYLKGVGEYDPDTRQHYFKLRDIYNYNQYMSKGKHEREFDFRQFLFKTISSNG